jgi:hypothetical protein
MVNNADFSEWLRRPSGTWKVSEDLNYVQWDLELDESCLFKWEEKLLRFGELENWGKCTLSYDNAILGIRNYGSDGKKNWC